MVRRARPAARLKEYVDKFWWPTKENTLQQTSLDSYEQDLRLRILPHFANVEFAKIDRLAVQQMINDCGTASTAKRARDLLRAIINDAIDSGAAASCSPGSSRRTRMRGACGSPPSLSTGRCSWRLRGRGRWRRSY